MPQKKSSNIRPTVSDILKSHRDIMGEWSKAQKDGPKLSQFSDLTKPLNCVNAPWVYYPIPLGFPGMEKRFRLVSNGSEIHIGTDINLPFEGVDGYNTWYGVERKIKFLLGNKDHMFGRDNKTISAPELEQGCIPIYKVEYCPGKTKYEIEGFAARVSGLNSQYVVAVRLTSDKKTNLFKFKFSDSKIKMNRGVVFDSDNKMIASIKGGVKNKHNEVIVKGNSAVIVVPLTPVKLEWDSFLNRVKGRLDDETCKFAYDLWAENLSSEDSYSDMKKQTKNWWMNKLSEGTIPDLPESYVSKALKTVLLNVHNLAEGDQLNYSLGNAYQRPYSLNLGFLRYASVFSDISRIADV